jgi:hypothetical protein
MLPKPGLQHHINKINTFLHQSIPARTNLSVTEMMDTPTAVLRAETEATSQLAGAQQVGKPPHASALLYLRHHQDCQDINAHDAPGHIMMLCYTTYIWLPWAK